MALSCGHPAADWERMDDGRWGRRCVEETCRPEHRYTQITAHDPSDPRHPDRLSGNAHLLD